MFPVYTERKANMRLHFSERIDFGAFSFAPKKKQWSRLEVKKFEINRSSLSDVVLVMVEFQKKKKKLHKSSGFANIVLQGGDG